LGEFGPDALRSWAAELGTETYVGTSGRVFPEGQKAAGLLRGWVRRLRDAGVQFENNARLLELQRENNGWQAGFHREQERFAVTAPAVVLALGGASWPDTGSDGTWPALLASHNVAITPWQPANCGWNVAWPEALLARAEGLPLKNLTVSAGAESISGELLITKDGIEGGAIYRLGRILRRMERPQISIDLKPQLPRETLRQRLHAINAGGHWSKLCKLSPAATALIEIYFGDECDDADQLTRRIKSFPLSLVSPRPIAEAISSAGGVKWDELDAGLMLRKMPGVFIAGEMIDWEAPTGGYLLQGCFSTGTRAGRTSAEWARR
ncbi:MAG: TIGR03862 family flavoprotein, partial [Verrucomicrobiota bacterium]|nr:TIGR03862 family flavoprotein [Verrucomicrobiota bacterium]